MGVFVDLTGRKFNRLLVLEQGPYRKGYIHWRCRCDCGRECLIPTTRLVHGNSKSCGCLVKEVFQQHRYKDGRCGTKTWLSYRGMLARCTCPQGKDVEWYKGVTICERWRGPNGYQNFLSDMGERPDGMSLDRYPNNRGNYEPGNCRWATPQQQSQNRRTARLLTHDGKTLNMSEWARLAGISQKVLFERLQKMPLKEALEYRPRRPSLTANRILREFMADIEAIGAKQVGHEWPDILVTYNKARMYFANKET